jgi:ABC-type transport system involved in multi-copper enzyme maturation permease subunit
MTSPLRYEFLRTMKSKSMVVSVGVMIALSLGLVPLVNLATSPFVYNNGGVGLVGYYSAPDYHFLAYSYNGYGQPVQGTPVNITIAGASGSHSSSAGTNSSGFASWRMTADPPNPSTTYVLSTGTATGVSGGSGNFPPGVKDGDILVLGQNFGFVVNPSNSSQREVLFFQAGPYGALPEGYKVYYNYSAVASNQYGQTDETQLRFLGDVSSYLTVLRLPQPPPGTTVQQIAVFDSNASLVTSSVEVTQGGTSTPVTPRQVFAAFTSSILAIVVPLMAILVAYNSYGKDRATGVLESVLARPVTRRGLGVSRYLSMLISMSVGLTVTMLAMEGISQLLLGAVLPADFAAYTVGSLIVEAASFIGLTMLLSHFVKSTGGLIGAGLVIWIVLDFFWGVFVLVGSYILGVQIGSGDYIGVTIDSSFFNPAQFYSLVSTYIGSAASVGSGISISPATYGLTPLTIAVAAAFWVVAPLAAFLYVAARTD